MSPACACSSRKKSAHWPAQIDPDAPTFGAGKGARLVVNDPSSIRFSGSCTKVEGYEGFASVVIGNASDWLLFAGSPFTGNQDGAIDTGELREIMSATKRGLSPMTVCSLLYISKFNQERILSMFLREVKFTVIFKKPVYLRYS